jgi:hypothetical protein
VTMWYGGNGWGWCSTIAHIPSMVILWALVFAITIIAVGFATRPRHDPPAPTVAASVRPEGAPAARIGRSETDDDDFYRRLM